MRFLTISLVALISVGSSAAQGQVYKCVDTHTKKVSYSGTPCTSGEAKELAITDNAIMDGTAAQREVAKTKTGESANTALRGNERALRGNERAAEQQRANTQVSAGGPDFPDQKRRLASECVNGDRGSCRTLHTLNAATASGSDFYSDKEQLGNSCARGVGGCRELGILTQASGLGPEHLDERNRLANECTRGFSWSCVDLRKSVAGR